MRALLDTNVLLLGLLPPADYLDLKVSSLTWAEIRRGIGKYRGDGDHGRARRFQAQYDRLEAAFGAGLPFDDSCAAAYQEVVELTHAAGRDARGRLIDLMLAATAVAHSAAVVTHNPSDFAGLEDAVRVVAV